MWGGFFSTYDCSLVAIRQKEDPFNAIGAGFLTGFTLAARQGLRRSIQQGMIGGVLLALIEGLGIGINRMAVKMQTQNQEAMMAQEAMGNAPPMPELSPGHALSDRRRDEFESAWDSPTTSFK